MDAELISLHSDSLGDTIPDVAILRQITTGQLLKLGKCQVVYVKTDLHDGGRVIILYEADGVPMLMLQDTAQAAKTAMYLNLQLHAVH